MSQEILNENSFRQIEGESLPIFIRNVGELTLFYAPGYLAAAGKRKAAEIRQILSGEIPFGDPEYSELIRFASSACSYSSPVCNLKCTYCFAESARRSLSELDTEFILKSAREVLENCRESGAPFTAVFHGGGEPSLDPRMPELLTKLKAMSELACVPFFSYIATNGVMDAEKAR